MVCLWTAQQLQIPDECATWVWQRLSALMHPMSRKQLQTALRQNLLAYCRANRPRAVLVQGDTLSAYAGAYVAAVLDIPLIHLEAGLRSNCLRSPFPEEIYRCRIARLASLHLAPSQLALQTLHDERARGLVKGQILMVGSTAIDALPAMRALGRPTEAFELVVDVHRRENAGRNLHNLAQALRSFAQSGRRIALLAHPNSQWQSRWQQALGDAHGLHYLPPLSQKQWLAQAMAARLVLSDSGGAAEELPYLGVPLLVFRRATERPEGFASGHCRWLRPAPATDLLASLQAAFADSTWPAAWAFAASSPYGDGQAGPRAATVIASWLEQLPSYRAQPESSLAMRECA